MHIQIIRCAQRRAWWSDIHCSRLIRSSRHIARHFSVFQLSRAPGPGIGLPKWNRNKRRGKPGMIVSDHGTEFARNAMLAWS